MGSLLEMHYAMLPLLLDLLHYDIPPLVVFLGVYMIQFPLVSLRSTGHVLWYLCATVTAKRFMSRKPLPPYYNLTYVVHMCIIMWQMFQEQEYESLLYLYWCIVDVLVISRDLPKFIYEIGTFAFFIILQPRMNPGEFIRNLCVFSVLLGLLIYAAQKFWKKRAVKDEPVAETKKD